MGAERLYPHIQPSLFEIVVAVRNNEPFFRQEFLEEDGWKYLVDCRHYASLALARPDLLWINPSRALEWVNQSNNVLLEEEKAPCMKHKLILPNSGAIPLDIQPATMDFFGQEVEVGIDINPDIRFWFEPSIQWLWQRTADQLDVPNRTVGLTTGKWRLPTIAHMFTLYETRKRCDYMLVGADPTEIDILRITDGFVPEYEDKVNMLHNIRFPDGSAIDLIHWSHLPDIAIKQYLEKGFWGWFLPLVIDNRLEYTQIDEKLARFVGVLPANVVLDISRAFKSQYYIERAERIHYCVSEKDPYLKIKQFNAAMNGIGIETIPYPDWMHQVSSSHLVEKFQLAEVGFPG